MRNFSGLDNIFDLINKFERQKLKTEKNQKPIIDQLFSDLEKFII